MIDLGPLVGDAPGPLVVVDAAALRESIREVIEVERRAPGDDPCGAYVTVHGASAGPAYCVGKYGHDDRQEAGARLHRATMRAIDRWGIPRGVNVEWYE